MDRSQFTQEELSFMEWLKRPSKLNKHSAKRLISELSEQSLSMAIKLSNPSTRRLEKNQLRVRIEGRRKFITHLENQFGIQ